MDETVYQEKEKGWLWARDFDELEIAEMIYLRGTCT